MPEKEDAGWSKAVSRPGVGVRSGLRKGFTWMFFGSASYQACQWLMLAAMTKLLAPPVVGQFVLALAICTPITILSTLQLRGVQVTDTRNLFSFGQYLATRIVTALLAQAVISIIIVAHGYPLEFALITFAIGLGQGVLTLRETYLSTLQKHERMSSIAVSQMIQGAGNLGFFITAIWISGNLLVGAVALLAARFVSMLVWDIPSVRRLFRELSKDSPLGRPRPQWQARAMLQLALLALPLGITAFVASLTMNIPRYLIESHLGKDSLAYFAAVMSLPASGAIIIGAAGSTVQSRLAMYHDQNRRAFRTLLSKLVMLGLAMGAAGVAVALLAGRQLLTIAFTARYAEHHGLLGWLMAYGGMSYVAAFLGYGMTAARRFRSQVPLALAIGITVGAVTAVLLPRFGLTAAAFGFLAGATVQAMGSLLILLPSLRNLPLAAVSEQAVPIIMEK